MIVKCELILLMKIIRLYKTGLGVGSIKLMSNDIFEF